jgi:hypothetical protein
MDILFEMGLFLKLIIAYPFHPFEILSMTFFNLSETSSPTFLRSSFLITSKAGTGLMAEIYAFPSSVS